MSERSEFKFSHDEFKRLTKEINQEYRKAELEKINTQWVKKTEFLKEALKFLIWQSRAFPVIKIINEVNDGASPDDIRDCIKMARDVINDFVDCYLDALDRLEAEGRLQNGTKQ